MQNSLATRISDVHIEVLRQTRHQLGLDYGLYLQPVDLDDVPPPRGSLDVDAEYQVTFDKRTLDFKSLLWRLESTGVAGWYRCVFRVFAWKVANGC